MTLVGGMEMGGTKIVCAVSRDGTDVLAEYRYATGADPKAALATAIRFFTEMQEAHGRLLGIGVAAFGPCDPDPGSPRYGFITSTPKPGWRDVDVLGALRAGLGAVRLGFDTDVNAAALGELRHGAGRGLDSLVYLTVGTGIGGGGVVEGRLIHGLVHPEMGHIRVPRPPEEVEVFAGVCPFHGDCLEGVAAGPAIEARWGTPGQDLPEDHPAWGLEADYLAYALATIVYVLSPQRIVLGGGVGQSPALLARLRPRLVAINAGYIQHAALESGIDDYVVPPGLGNQAGVIGALTLVEEAA